MFCFFFYCNFSQETSYLLGNVYMYIAPRIIVIYQKDWKGSPLASASPMLPPCYYYLLVLVVLVDLVVVLLTIFI